MVRLGLFLSSYSIMFLILAIRFELLYLQLMCLALAAGGMVSLVLILRRERAKKPGSHTVTGVENRGSEVAGYLVSYLLPFIAIPQPSGRDLAGYLIFLVVVAVIYMQSDMIQINPLFYLLRRRVYRITTSDRGDAYLIARHRPLQCETIKATVLGNRVWVRYGEDDGVARRQGQD